MPQRFSRRSGGTLEPGDLRARALLTLAEIDYWRKGESAAAALAEEALARRPRPAGPGPLPCGDRDVRRNGRPDEGGCRRARRACIARRPAADTEPGLVAAALGARVRADLFLGEGLDSDAARRALALERDAPPPAADHGSSSSSVSGSAMSTTSTAREPVSWQAEQAARDEGDESSLANILLNRMVVETWAGTGTRPRRSRTAWPTRSHSRAWSPRESARGGRTSTRTPVGSRPSGAAFEAARPDEPIVAMIWNRCIGLAALAAGEGTRPTGTSPRRLPNSTASTSASRRSGAWTATRSRRRSWSARSTGPNVSLAALRGTGRPLTDPLEPGRLGALPRSPPGRGRRSRGRRRISGAGARRARALPDAVRAGAHAARPGADPPPPEAEASGAWSLEQALAIFRGLDAERWVRRTEAELARVAVRRAPDELSATELRIAHLAASG